jgi:hypothetical protein
MNDTPLCWLAAEYHLPATCSCRLPFSSSNSALVSPAPGPATVRLALIRTGLEIFGRDVVRDSLFPWIRAAPVLIRPPERVALSEQVLRAYKADVDKGRVSFGESVVYRQMAHAQGTMTVYLELPRQERETWETLLRSVGYWGQASSFATCLEVSERVPLRYECAQPLQALSDQSPIRPFFSCVLTEFRDSHVTWQEVVPFDGPYSRTAHNPLKLEVYAWPLQVVRQDGQNTLLMRAPLA